MRSLTISSGGISSSSDDLLRTVSDDGNLAQGNSFIDILLLVAIAPKMNYQYAEGVIKIFVAVTVVVLLKRIGSNDKLTISKVPPKSTRYGFRSSSTLAVSYFTLKASSFNICWERKKKGNYYLKEVFKPDMPKQKRYKNLLKAAAAAHSSQDKSIAAANSSQDKSIAATNSSRDKSAASNASQVKSAASANFSRNKLAAAANFSRDKSVAAANFSRDKSAAAANSSQDKSATSNSSRDKLAASNSSRDKLTATNSSRDKSTTVANEYEDTTRLHLLVKDVHNLLESLRIVVNFDRQHAAVGEAAGLLAGVCGQLATDCVAFPISFDKWSDIPESFFENQWNIFFQARFCFKVCDSLAKRFLLQSLGKKWREHRIKLWSEFYDPRLSKTEIINNTPEDIALDQWALFVEYRLKPETQTEETGKEVSRVQMWDITHKKIDGSYVNEKAKEIAEGGKIPVELAGMFPTQQISQGLDQESGIPSPRELGSRSSGASNKEA
ncbi:hypothetical protein Ahy_B06g082592 isoform E [Arachis hypogaea]|uniref:Uncharacterized protein n=1 Tax=Arachis hypogaea TaxID=3818 RepID=A0A444YNK7_ARAHY|nr:hypothetical protein Ahy_B06g082592 isoform E [Arachis hypogaea]